MTNIKITADVCRLLAIQGPFCHICGLIMDLRLQPNIRIRCTRDHITPRSKGGKNRKNILLAHGYCNAKRGADDLTNDTRELCKAWVKYYVGQDALDVAEKYFKSALMFKIKKHIENDPTVPSDVKACWSDEVLWRTWEAAANEW